MVWGDDNKGGGWQPGKSCVSTNVLRTPIPARTPDDSAISTPGIAGPTPLIKAKDIAPGGISFSSQIANTIANWTPILQFGGATTGITYTTQLGFLSALGKLVYAQFQIVLTSKGTATGQATITGLSALSYSQGSLIQSLLPVFYANFTADVNGGVLCVGIGPGTNTANLVFTGGSNTGTSTVTNTSFTNTTTLSGAVLLVTT